MSRHPFTTALLASTLFTVITATGCGKKADNDSAGGAAKTAEAKPAATKLPKLNLQIDIPGEVTLGDAIMGEGHMVQGDVIGALQVETWKDAQTIAQAKDDASAFTPKHEKTETLPDGWTLTFDNTGSMGANYFVTVRRDIAGKSYKCSTTGDKPEQAAAVLAACKSLRP